MFHLLIHRPPGVASQRLGSFRTADIRRIVHRDVEEVGLRAVPDGADDGSGHYVVGTGTV